MSMMMKQVKRTKKKMTTNPQPYSGAGTASYGTGYGTSVPSGGPARRRPVPKSKK